MLVAKTPIYLNLSTERDLRYYQFAGLLMRAIATFKEHGEEDIKEFNMVDALSGRMLSKGFTGGEKELIESLKEAKVRIICESS